MRRGAKLDRVLPTKEGLAGSVKLKGSLGCSDQEMVEFKILRAARRAHSKVKEEEQSANHTLMIQETLQQASVELSEQHHLVVSSDEVEGIETVTVYTQGGEASEFIVYVQEALQPVEEQTVEQSVQEL
ncbi:zinc finger protein zfat-like [Limosa lapponica baueri]|uniref:Zinc finger protein zfat-like n=1 Tax=Limosa lapponica baueri TaxID=1758121 RepID=A0A2I0T7Z4_LIMLA|nr:zinc finger protein zfat-like [Limosa lapponica baueri]